MQVRLIFALKSHSLRANERQCLYPKAEIQSCWRNGSHLSNSLFLLGIELISDTIGKLNTISVATSDDNLIPPYVLTQAYWTVVLDLGDW